MNVARCRWHWRCLSLGSRKEIEVSALLLRLTPRRTFVLAGEAHVAAATHPRNELRP